MGGLSFAQQNWVHLVWAALALVALLALLELRARDTLGQFVSNELGRGVDTGREPQRLGVRVPCGACVENVCAHFFFFSLLSHLNS